ncbi:hypothetical protein Pflav_011360 [Phytohabitans flavus]|uniref:NAD(+)--protein-arginine ADP-ribosyltransferase n=1 Tax=Phytohabitans flavus TaxID=1076124 RepID=A0A6F8XLN7_9ACTN|nr:hypothetical protein [Phytohabitans flavus]BCB74726.1 hypothetical protein Pflav_011360 [Phytohabitans flavus]
MPLAEPVLAVPRTLEPALDLHPVVAALSSAAPDLPMPAPAAPLLPVTAEAAALAPLLPATAEAATLAAGAMPAVGAPVNEVAMPLRLPTNEWGAADHAALRRALNGRYDAHSRQISRILAEEPGLRGTGATPEVVSGLVALRAYHSGERDAVNQALRTGGGGGALDRAVTIARGAAYGLRRLPTVLGPVFRSGRIPAATLAAYRPGLRLVEPGFLDAEVGAVRERDATVEFRIWSSSARRLGWLDIEDAPGAIFPPATWFEVLAVDEPESGPRQVLMRDLTGGSAATRLERILARLRGFASDLEPSGTTLVYAVHAPGWTSTATRTGSRRNRNLPAASPIACLSGVDAG